METISQRSGDNLTITKRKLGDYYEHKASQFLQAKGLLLIEQNYQSRVGEIDLIMKDKTCLVFVEVRYRKHSLYGDAQSTVTTKKQQKVMNAALLWMQQQNLNSEAIEYRFDVFAITGKQSQWIQNAFASD